MGDLDAEFGSPLAGGGGGSGRREHQFGGSDMEGMVPAGAPPELTSAAAARGLPLLMEPPEVVVDPHAADVYAGLWDSGGGTLLQMEVTQLKDRAHKQEAEVARLKKEVEALSEQKGTLEQRATTLTANISALYNTAKLELQRKDAEIRGLRERLAAQQGAKGPPPPGPSGSSRLLPGGGSAAAAGGTSGEAERAGPNMEHASSTAVEHQQQQLQQQRARSREAEGRRQHAPADRRDNSRDRDRGREGERGYRRDRDQETDGSRHREQPGSSRDREMR